MKTRNLLLAGIGGQGVVLAGEIICLALLETGVDVKKSEVIGMAQRGGSVTSHVRYGHQVHSPLIPKGKVDIMIGFEAFETFRRISYLKKKGLLLLNPQKIMPSTASLGRQNYPEDIDGLLRQAISHLRIVEGQKLARTAGDIRAVNSVLLGALSRELNIPKKTWEKVIAQRLPKKLVAMNLQAFTLGRTDRQAEGAGDY